MKPLTGKVAVVAGATRGAGRGVARMLGEAGATVYCTGRSSRTQANTSDHVHAGRPETIEETAELVTDAGGVGIPVRVDHNVEPEVADLFKRVKREQKRLDVLVNVLTGQPVQWGQGFHKTTVAKGRELIDSWIWPHITTARYAVPLMTERKSGLLVEIIEQKGIGYHSGFYFDLFEIILKRSAFALAEEFGPKGITALSITPGFMRTEAILEGYGATEATWRHAAEHNAQAKAMGFSHSETPCFIGRAIAALAADPNVRQKSGGIYTSHQLSEEYGFTDLDGTRPNIWKMIDEMFSGAPNAPVQWRLTRAHTNSEVENPAEMLQGV